MIITRTPLRISLAGGGTDIPPYAHDFGGACVSLAINKYVYVITKPRFENNFRISYTKTEIVPIIDDIQHDLIRECLRFYRSDFLEIVTLADVPGEGTGLGSSGAVLVGTIANLEFGTNKGNISPVFCAEMASQIEMDILGKNSGYQDQYASAYGGLNCHYFAKGGNIAEPLPDGEHIIDKLMLFYTGKIRQASDLLSSHKNASKEYLDNQKALAIEMKEVIKRGYINDVGIILDEGWELKRTISGVTSPEIDHMYQKAKNTGAMGGKICGAGGGGFLCLFVPLEKQTAVRKALSGYHELRFGLDTDGVKVVCCG